VVGPDDEEDDLRDEVMSDLTSLLNSIDKSGRGVCVQASTLGSLEALLDFLKASKIPVSGINIGPVHKRDIMRAATMLEKARELACILCFDVSVDKDADRLAEEMGIRLFKGNMRSDFCLLSVPSDSTPCSGYHLPLVRLVYGIQRRDRRGEAP
jgi:translation initiation factor 5B